jgi:hypothetical protein
MLVEDIALRDGGSVARETFRGWLLRVGLAYLSLGNYVTCLERLGKVLERRLVGLSVFIYSSICLFLYISTLILYYGMLELGVIPALRLLLLRPQDRGTQQAHQ